MAIFHIKSYYNIKEKIVSTVFFHRYKRKANSICNFIWTPGSKSRLSKTHAYCSDGCNTKTFIPFSWELCRHRSTICDVFFSIRDSEFLHYIKYVSKCRLVLTCMHMHWTIVSTCLQKINFWLKVEKIFYF